MVPLCTRSPSLADLSPDVLADVATRLTVADVGHLMLVSRGVRDSVLSNDHLWAMQYCNRWVRTRHHAPSVCQQGYCSILSTVAQCQRRSRARCEPPLTA